MRRRQATRLASDLDRVSRDKVDMTSLEHYSQRVSGLFESVAAQLADEVSALTGQLRREVADVAEQAEGGRAREQVRRARHA